MFSFCNDNRKYNQVNYHIIIVLSTRLHWSNKAYHQQKQVLSRIVCCVCYEWRQVKNRGGIAWNDTYINYVV